MFNVPNKLTERDERFWSLDGLRTHLLEGEFARSDHVFGRNLRIGDVRELTALKGEPCVLHAIVACVEMRVLNVLLEVGDQELAPVAELCSTHSLGSLRALPTVTDLEEATI